MEERGREIQGRWIEWRERRGRERERESEGEKGRKERIKLTRAREGTTIVPPPIG